MDQKQEQEEYKNPLNFQSNRILNYDQMVINFEQIFKSKENCYCFECGQPAKTWASVNNAIFLCMKCSQIHRSFGINISFIRSVELDCWNEKQLILLQLGGNENLKNFFESYKLYDIAGKDDSSAIGYKYFTKAAQYYRNKLNAMVEKMQVIPEPPSIEEGQQLIDIKSQIFPTPPVANQIELYQIQETANGEKEKEEKESFFSFIAQKFKEIHLKQDIKNIGFSNLQDKIESFSKEQYDKMQSLVKSKNQQVIAKEPKQEEEKKTDEIQQQIEIEPTLSQKITSQYNKIKNQIQLGADQLENKYNKSEFKVKLKTYQEKVSLQTKKISEAVSKQTSSVATKIKEGYQELRSKKKENQPDQPDQPNQSDQPDQSNQPNQPNYPNQKIDQKLDCKIEEQKVQNIDKIEL